MSARFGTDGIRGEVGGEINAALATQVGYALAVAAGLGEGRLGEGGVGRAPRLALAMDTRPSGPMLEAAALAGMLEAGAQVDRLGVLPTAGVSAWIAAHGLDGGLMITASHNPPADNGLKAMGPSGGKLEGAARAAIEALLSAPRTYTPGGRAFDHAEAARARYVQAVRAALPEGRWLAGQTLALDTANGAGQGVAGQLLVALGARVISLGDGPGDAINVGVGALHPAALQAAVVAHGAAAGIALDGDGDRVLLVDASGRALDGDALLHLCAASLPPGAAVVGTILSNLGLEKALGAAGRRLIRTPVGDAHVAAAMGPGAPLGGEPSGHLLFLDGLPTADGMLAALRALSPGPASLSERLAAYTPCPQATAAVRVPAAAIPRAAEAVAAAEADGGRVVVRPSGTEPVVRVMVEHLDSSLARAALDRIVTALQGYTQ